MCQSLEHTQGREDGAGGHTRWQVASPQMARKVEVIRMGVAACLAQPFHISPNNVHPGRTRETFDLASSAYPTLDQPRFDDAYAVAS